MVAVYVDPAVVLHLVKMTYLGDSTIIYKKSRLREKG